jgi:hypothetical protein
MVETTRWAITKAAPSIVKRKNACNDRMNPSLTKKNMCPAEAFTTSRRNPILSLLNSLDLILVNRLEIADGLALVVESDVCWCDLAL